MDQRDRDRLSSDYEALLAPGHRARWTLENAGNRRALAERLQATEAVTAGRLAGGGGLILDLGCGGFTILPTALQHSMRIGLDILIERLRTTSHGRSTSEALVNADGARLPFRSGAFDAVIVATMMSSVREDRARQQISAEIRRVLVTGGVVVWYDFRYPSPGNRAVRPVRRRSLKRLFSGMQGVIVSTTLLPPLARHLGRSTDRLYPLLSRIPAMRSHLVACFVKVAD